MTEAQILQDVSNAFYKSAADQGLDLAQYTDAQKQAMFEQYIVDLSEYEKAASAQEQGAAAPAPVTQEHAQKVAAADVAVDFDALRKATLELFVKCAAYEGTDVNALPPEQFSGAWATFAAQHVPAMMLAQMQDTKTASATPTHNEIQASKVAEAEMVGDVIASRVAATLQAYGIAPTKEASMSSDDAAHNFRINAAAAAKDPRVLGAAAVGTGLVGTGLLAARKGLKRLAGTTTPAKTEEEKQAEAQYWAAVDRTARELIQKQAGDEQFAADVRAHAERLLAAQG